MQSYVLIVFLTTFLEKKIYKSQQKEKGKEQA